MSFQNMTLSFTILRLLNDSSKYALLFQSLTVESLEAEASKVPVGFMATSYTAPLCPKNF
jgi:hypothetical protein